MGKSIKMPSLNVSNIERSHAKANITDESYVTKINETTNEDF